MSCLYREWNMILWLPISIHFYLSGMIFLDGEEGGVVLYSNICNDWQLGCDVSWQTQGTDWETNNLK